MIGLIEPRRRPTTTASTPRSPAPRPSTTTPCGSRPTEPDGVLPARMYWLKIVAARHRGHRRPVRRAERHRPVHVRRPRDRRVDRARRQPRLLGRRAVDRQRSLRVRRRGRHPPRRAQVGALRPHHQPRARPTSTRRRPIEADPGPGAPGPHPRRRRGHHRRPQRPPGAQPRGRQGRASPKRSSAASPASTQGQLLSAVDPRLQRHARAVPVRPRARPSSCSRTPASPARRSQLVGESSGRWLNDRELVEAIAGYWTGGRPRGRPADASSSAPTSTSCSTATTARTRSSCRARTTCSTPTASSARTTRPVASARRTPTQELSALIDQGRSELDPDARAAHLPAGGAARLRQAYFVWLVNNQDLYGLSERLSGRRGSTPSCSSKDMSVTG